MKKLILSAVFALGILFSPAFISHTEAAALTQAQINSIVLLLQTFGADQSAIANVQTALGGGGSSGGDAQSWCHTFNTDIKIGDQNGEVAALQTALTRSSIDTGNGSSDPTPLFNENVAAAVVQFQSRYSIRQTGYVGPMTRAKLNQLYSCTGNVGAPTATLTVNGQASIANADPLAQRTWAWSSTNGSSYNMSATLSGCETASQNGTVPNWNPWTDGSGTGASGSNTQIPGAVKYGCTIMATYTVTNFSGQSSSANGTITSANATITFKHSTVARGGSVLVLSTSNSPSGPFVVNGNVQNNLPGYFRINGGGLSQTNPPKGCTQPVSNSTCQSASNYRDYLLSEWIDNNTIQTVASVASGYPLGTYEFYILYAGGSPIKVGTASLVAASAGITCTSFTYSAYGACQSNNTQTRTVTSSSPTNCTGGSPTLSQSCTYTGGQQTQSCSGTPGSGTGVVLYPYTNLTTGGASNTVWKYSQGGGSCVWTCTPPMIQNGDTGCKSPTPGTGTTITIHKLDGGSVSGISLAPSDQIGYGPNVAGSPFLTDINGKTAEFWFTPSGPTNVNGVVVDVPGYKIRSASGATCTSEVWSNRTLNRCSGMSNGTPIIINMVPGNLASTPIINITKSTYKTSESLSGSVVGGDPNHTWGCIQRTGNTDPAATCTSGYSTPWRLLGSATDVAAGAAGWNLVTSNQGDMLSLQALPLASFPPDTYTMYVRTGTSALDSSGLTSHTSAVLTQ